MKLNLQARLVAAIAQFKASNDIRYYLNGVYVEPRPSGGAVIMPLRDQDAPLPAWIKPMLTRGEMERRAKEAPLPVHEPSDAGPPEGDGRGWQIVRGQK